MVLFLDPSICLTKHDRKDFKYEHVYIVESVRVTEQHKT